MTWPSEVAWLHSTQGQRKFLPVETTGIEPVNPALQSLGSSAVCGDRCSRRLRCHAWDTFVLRGWLSRLLLGAISNEWSVTVVFGPLFGLETATRRHSWTFLAEPGGRCATADPDIYYW
jgi:hypothetical protein